MLSRTADNLFWLSRYVERADYLARILETTSRMSVLPAAYTGDTNDSATMNMCKRRRQNPSVKRPDDLVAPEQNSVSG